MTDALKNEMRAQIHHRKVHVRTEEKASEEIRPANTSVSDFQPPELAGSKFLWFKPPSPWYFATAAQADKYRIQR